MTGTLPNEPQVRLCARLRDLLANEPTTREVSMFGGRAFMVNERILVSAGKNGDLLVRVATERSDELLALAGVTRAQMKNGRKMGVGWITVAADAIGTDGQLKHWLLIALAHNDGK